MNEEMLINLEEKEALEHFANRKNMYKSWCPINLKYAFLCVIILLNDTSCCHNLLDVICFFYLGQINSRPQVFFTTCDARICFFFLPDSNKRFILKSR